MTTAAKQVGGPKALLVGVGVLGYLAVRGLEAGATAVHRKRWRAFKNESESTSDDVFVVTADGDDGNGLTVLAGNEVRVLKDVGEAVLVEIIGGQNNPYMVSPTFLASVCGWKSKET
ncbi:hypothetical protein ACWEJ7_01705 [Streptomyces albidoflavus]